MRLLRYTLVSEGSTDANLIPIINWTLEEVGKVELVQGVRAEFWRLPEPPGALTARIINAVDLFPCDALFVHRDADREPAKNRHDEIRAAVEVARQGSCRLPAVAVVPVRMLEAWLLFDELAIRSAAGNPNGQSPLNLPPLTRVEDRPDPKRDLREALRTASELSGRRLKKFNTSTAFWRVVDFIRDFSPLRQLPAFRQFEKSVAIMSANEWRPDFY